MTQHDAYAALRIPNIRRFALGRLTAVTGGQMLSVAVGWQLYERTHSAWALGLVGLVQILPVVALALPAGQAADRLPRRHIAVGAHSALFLCALGLAYVSYTGADTRYVYAILVAIGSAIAFRSPSVGAMLPQLTPPGLLANANTWISSGFQLAMMAGPALGGFVIAATGTATPVYLVAACAHLVFIGMLLTLPLFPAAAKPGAPGKGWREMAAGLRFIFRNEVLVAAMTLDLFAVLLGGATALLPIYARDILHVGASGLGWLRAAPAIGAFATAIVLTRLPPIRRAGPALLWSVAGFGAATVVFGLSTSFALSMVMLALTGAFDNVSVVIRLTLEQSLTPDAMRGRVSSVHYVFIGLSNELGEFESGSTAALVGPIASVAAGGVGTLLVVGIVALVWPKVRKLGALADLRPVEDTPPN